MKRSTAALIIAILSHLLIILLFWVLGMVAPKPEKPPKPEEHRIKVSLKNKPETGKDAVIEKKQEKPEIAPPMPKGKQLKELVEKPFKKVAPEPKPVPRPKPVTRQPVRKKEPPKPEKPVEKTKPLPPKKSYIPVKETAEANRTKPVKKESERLYALLSKKVELTEKEKAKAESTTRQSRISENIKEAYGTTFGELSEGEQKYILDNQEIMRRITQQVLNRVGSVNIPRDMRINSYNIVEFYLYPNGDISDIKFIEKSGFYILDDTTRETIEYAYSKYPRPEQKTRIRYKVGYYLRGY